MGYLGQKIGPSITGYISKGSMIAVTGSNGIGKSTFLKILARLTIPISGKLEFKQNKFSVSYLPQIKNIDYSFPVTVFDVVSMGCWPRIGFLSKLNIYQQNLIWKALEQVKLLDLLNRDINTLSGGQFQRVLFARILVQKSSLILLDEPFQGIDAFACKMLMRSIIRLNQYGSTIIVVVHNDKFIVKYFSKILLLHRYSSIWIS